MSMKLYNETDIENIADSIREPLGNTNTYKVREMAPAITNMANSLKALIPQNTVTGTNELVAPYSAGFKAIDYSIEGKSEQESTTGKNILDNNEETNTKQGVTFTNLGKGEFNLNGTLLNPIDGYIGRNLNAILKENTTYTLLFEVFGGDVQNIANITNIALNGTRDGADVFNMHYMNVKTATASTIIKSTFTTIGQETIKSCNLYVGSSGVIFNNYKIRVMVYEGTDNIPYEPYTGGQPSPSPEYSQEIKSVGNLVTSGEHQGKYEIPVKIRGKNEFKVTQNYKDYSLFGVTASINNNGTMTLNGTATRATEFKYMFDTEEIILKPNIHYYLVQNLISGNATETLIAYSLDNVVGTFTNNVKDLGISNTERTLKQIRVFVNNAVSFNNANIGVMLVRSVTDTSFEAYHEPVTVPIYLDEPLRGIGDKDLIEFLTQKRTNKVNKALLDTNSIGINDTYSNLTYASILKPSDFIGKGNYVFYTILCNKAIAGNVDSLGGYNSLNMIGRITPQPSSNNMWIGFPKGTTLEQMKTALANTEFVYQLATPTEETIQLPELPLFNGTNIIEIDTDVLPSNAEVVYYKDWRLG